MRFFKNRKKAVRVSILLMVSGYTIFWVASYYEWFELIDRMPYHKEIEKVLIDRLVISPYTHGETSHVHVAPSFPIAYLMNGDQVDLKHRISFSAQLYTDKLVEKILVARRPGITEYDNRLERNLSGDEWTMRQFHAEGIDEKVYEYVNVQNGFFGTLSEIESLLKLCQKKGCRRLAVISSDYHTGRIEKTLQALAGQQSIKWEVFGAPGPINLRILLVEWFKYIVYRYIVLPFY